MILYVFVILLSYYVRYLLKLNAIESTGVLFWKILSVPVTRIS